METNIRFKGVPLTVYYRYEGDYFPATRETPAEYPELEINKITVEGSDIDIQELLSWRDIEEIEEEIGDYE